MQPSPPPQHPDLSLTSILAIYGAILSSLTAAIQLINHLKDRPSVVLKVRKNMAMIHPDIRYAGMTMMIITAINIGRRPISIAGFAARLLREQDGAMDWYLPDVRPHLPHEITEGKEVSAFLNQQKVNFDLISHSYAWDTAGRYYRLNVTPWYKRWISECRYRYARGPKKPSEAKASS